MLPRGTQVCNPRNTTVLLRSKLLESHPVVIAVSAEQYASTTWRSKNASSMTKTGRRTTLRGAIYMLQAVLAGIIPLKATSRTVVGAEAFLQASHGSKWCFCGEHAARTRRERESSTRSFSPPSRYRRQLLNRRLQGRGNLRACSVIEQSHEEIAADGGMGISRYPRPRWLIQARKASRPSSSSSISSPHEASPRPEGSSTACAAPGVGFVKDSMVGRTRSVGAGPKPRIRKARDSPTVQRKQQRQRRKRRDEVAPEATSPLLGSPEDTWAGVPSRSPWGVDQRTRKESRTRGRPFVIVCDAEGVSHPELLECIDTIEQPGIRDVGVIYADWKSRGASLPAEPPAEPPRKAIVKSQEADPPSTLPTVGWKTKSEDWRSPMYPRSKADHFRTAQLDPVPSGTEASGEDRRMTDIMKISKSDTFRDFDFCLISSTDSMAYLAGRLQAEGRHVTGMGPRRAPTTFSSKCDSFVYMDPANRYELLMDEGLVISVALCIALAAYPEERCDWVRMKTIVNSLHSWDLGLEDPTWYGYTDYDGMIEEMMMYVRAVEATRGEVVLKVPPKPGRKDVAGLEDVTGYLHDKWSSFTADPHMNGILLSCVPACVYAVAMARAEVNAAVRRLRKRRRRAGGRDSAPGLTMKSGETHSHR